jgi:prolyl oligopeptidase
MKLYPLSIVLLVFAACNQPSTNTIEKLNYPKTRKVDTVTKYFGVNVADPYRWLENDTSAETAQWVKEENALTQSYLSKITFRDSLKKRLTELYHYEKYSVPFTKGKYVFFYKNSGSQNLSVLYVQEGLTGTPRVLLDPNTFSKDATVSVTQIAVSKDEKYLAYAISRAGSDWNEFYVLDIADGKQLSDTLFWSKFSDIGWKDDGFYYTRYDVPAKNAALVTENESPRIYYHKIGTPQSADQLIYEDKEHPMRTLGAYTTDDEKYLVIHSEESTDGNSLMIKNLAANNAPVDTVVSDFRSANFVIDNNGNSLLVMTNKGAPKYRLVSIDLSKPDSANWKDVLPEQENLLQGAGLTAGDKIIASYLDNVKTRLYVYSMDGKMINEIKLPGFGNSDFTMNKKSPVIFYSFTNYTTLLSMYSYDVASDKSTLFAKPDNGFKSDAYETEQVFYPSKDGTKIPMYIVHKKGLKMDGNNPCFMYAYGGFNVSYLPMFIPGAALFMENGGVYAVPNIRGGGEYGEKWHEAGTKLNKQNVFDDFYAASTYLVDNKYTSRSKLAIHGRSNGGLLVGASITEHPDMAKVAVATVGVMDMLRYHKFTIGWSWAGDYGTSDDPIQFHNLIKYSPLQNVHDTAYPATLITTGDHDDRVVPAHSFKFAATLQEHQKGDEPILIRIDHNAGHGGDKPKPMFQQIDEFTDIWSFVFYNLGMKWQG